MVAGHEVEILLAGADGGCHNAVFVLGFDVYFSLLIDGEDAAILGDNKGLLLFNEFFDQNYFIIEFIEGSPGSCMLQVLVFGVIVVFTKVVAMNDKQVVA